MLHMELSKAGVLFISSFKLVALILLCITCGDKLTAAILSVSQRLEFHSHTFKKCEVFKIPIPFFSEFSLSILLLVPDLAQFCQNLCFVLFALFHFLGLAGYIQLLVFTQVPDLS